MLEASFSRSRNMEIRPEPIVFSPQPLEETCLWHPMATGTWSNSGIRNIEWMSGTKSDQSWCDFVGFWIALLDIPLSHLMIPIDRFPYYGSKLSSIPQVLSISKTGRNTQIISTGSSLLHWQILPILLPYASRLSDHLGDFVRANRRKYSSHGAFGCYYMPYVGA